jgi:hypothetical protein
MKTFLLLAFCFALPSCESMVTTSSSSVETELKAEEALKAQIECGKNLVAKTDDGISDASTVAYALALRCNREYIAATDAWGNAKLSNENQRRVFRNKRSSTAEMVEAFLPTVMKYRLSRIRR